MTTKREDLYPSQRAKVEKEERRAARSERIEEIKKDDSKNIALLKALYRASLIDDSVSILGFAAFVVCEEMLTKEQREEIEREIFGETFEEWTERLEKSLKGDKES